MHKVSMIIRAAVVALLLVGLTSGRAFAEVKIAVVDLQRAINETEDGRQAKAKLKKLFEKRQVELDQKQNQLKKLKDDLEKQKDVLKKDVLNKKLQDYQKQFVELQTTYVDYQKELAQKEGEMTKGIVSRMEEILRRLGQSKGYTLILERTEAGIVWVPSNMDLTDTVIQKYNAGEGK